jgi:hypothetical protein
MVDAGARTLATGTDVETSGSESCDTRVNDSNVLSGRSSIAENGSPTDGPVPRTTPEVNASDLRDPP